MSDRAEIYVPAVARFPNDLENRHRLLEPARERGFKTGLMLVLRDQRDLEPEAIERQLGNLEPYVGLPEAERPAVFIMHPNKPLSGPKRLNFLDNPQYSQEYVEQSINFASRIPRELTPPSGQMVRFHLNTLVSPTSWVGDHFYWSEIFYDRVKPRIYNLSLLAHEKNLKIAVETTPIPEFGDMEKNDSTLMEDGHTYWADLGNPYPLLPWDIKVEPLGADVNLAIDWCHTFVALSTIYDAKRLIDSGRDGLQILQRYMIHYETFGLANALSPLGILEHFSRTVLDMTKPDDVWDVNDARGLYRTPELHGVQTYFEEGVTLFEGDIPTPHLQHLIREGVKRPIKFVLEINEDDFENSPNTKTSLARVLELV